MDLAKGVATQNRYCIIIGSEVFFLAVGQDLFAWNLLFCHGFCLLSANIGNKCYVSMLYFKEFGFSFCEMKNLQSIQRIVTYVVESSFFLLVPSELQSLVISFHVFIKPQNT